MSIENRKRDYVVEDRDYQMIKFGALKSIKLATSLGKQLGGGLASESGGGIATRILSSVDEEKTPALIQELLSGVSFQGRQLNIDNHFVDYPQDLVPLLAFSVKENILPFLSQNAINHVADLMTEWADTFQE